jgi:Cft2 family RNA processing exonuclease
MFYADSMVKVLSNGGSVLLPVDTAGRVLELLLIMEQVKSSFFITVLLYPVMLC